MADPRVSTLPSKSFRQMMAEGLAALAAANTPPAPPIPSVSAQVPVPALLALPPPALLLQPTSSPVPAAVQHQAEMNNGLVLVNHPDPFLHRILGNAAGNQLDFTGADKDEQADLTAQKYTGHAHDEVILERIESPAIPSAKCLLGEIASNVACGGEQARMVLAGIFEALPVHHLPRSCCESSLAVLENVLQQSVQISSPRPFHRKVSRPPAQLFLDDKDDESTAAKKLRVAEEEDKCEPSCPNLSQHSEERQGSPAVSVGSVVRREPDMTFLSEVIGTYTYRFPADLYDGVSLNVMWAISRWEKGCPFNEKLINFHPTTQEERERNFRLIEAIVGILHMDKAMPSLTSWNKSDQSNLARLLRMVRTAAFGEQESSSLKLKCRARVMKLNLQRLQELSPDEDVSIMYKDHEKEVWKYTSPAHGNGQGYAVQPAYFKAVSVRFEPVSVLGKESPAQLLDWDYISEYIRKALKTNVYAYPGQLRDGVAPVLLMWMFKCGDDNDRGFAFSETELRTENAFEAKQNFAMLKTALHPQLARHVNVEELLRSDDDVHITFMSFLLLEVFEEWPVETLLKHASTHDSVGLKQLHQLINHSAQCPRWFATPQAAKVSPCGQAMLRDNSKRLPSAGRSPGKHRSASYEDKEDQDSTETPPRQHSAAKIPGREGEAGRGKEASGVKRQRSYSLYDPHKRPEKGKSVPQGKSAKNKKTPSEDEAKSDRLSLMWDPKEGLGVLQSDAAQVIFSPIARDKRKCYEFGCCGKIWYGGLRQNAIRHIFGMAKNSTSDTGRPKGVHACKEYRENPNTRNRFLLHMHPEVETIEFELDENGDRVGDKSLSLPAGKTFYHSTDDVTAAEVLDDQLAYLTKEKLLKRKSTDDEKLEQLKLLKVRSEEKLSYQALVKVCEGLDKSKKGNMGRTKSGKPKKGL